ncbi:hypothetical protein FQA39_LY08511 [Lamprigera yunnana]|nr:hypothetical protein FQA39_LY08511 [Lamprigera yunnana]
MFKVDESNNIIKTVNHDLSCIPYEEADTKIVFHVCQINNDGNIIMKCFDADVLIILLGNMTNVRSRSKIWIESGTAIKKNHDVSTLYNSMGPLVCKALPRFQLFLKNFKVKSLHEKFFKNKTEFFQYDHNSKSIFPRFIHDPRRKASQTGPVSHDALLAAMHTFQKGTKSYNEADSRYEIPEPTLRRYFLIDTHRSRSKIIRFVSVASKKKFWNPRKWFKRKSNKPSEESLPTVETTEVNVIETLRSRSTSEIAETDETHKRSGTPMHPGLSVSHDSIFHSPHSGSELELEEAQSSSSLSIQHQPTQTELRLQTELSERLRLRRGRGDTSEDDEGLPRSPCCNSPTAIEALLEKTVKVST